MVFIDFRYVVSQWESIGVFDVLMPMILIFTLVFAILQKSKVLGAIKGIDAIVAFVVAFFTISNPTVSALFMPIFSNVALGIIILVSILLFVGLVFEEKALKDKMWIVFIAGMAIFLWIMSRVFSFYGYYIPSDWFSSENLVWIIPIILAIVAFMAITSSTKRKEKGIFVRPED